jgi:hypothetical protein
MVYTQRKNFLTIARLVRVLQGVVRKYLFKKNVLSKVRANEWNPLHDAAYRGVSPSIILFTEYNYINDIT